MTEELGRLWEARAWYREALRLQSRLSWAQAGYQRVNELLRRQKESKASLPVNPAQTIDF